MIKPEIRRVINSSVQQFGEKWKNELLKPYNGKLVELRGSKYGFDIYYENKFVCYIKTLSNSTIEWKEKRRRDERLQSQA